MEHRLGAVADDQHASSAINVFVTGQPGVGKSWLVINAAKKLPKDVIAGFYTVEARNPKTGEKIGFDIETFSGERAPLSRMRRGCGPKVGKYYFALEDFERVALPLLKPTKGIKLHIVDEVGRMELQSERFRDALTALLASPQTAVFGSLRAPRFGHDLPFVEEIKQREDTATLTLTKSNRDATAQKVESILMNIVGPASVTGTDWGSQTECPPRTENETMSFDPAGFLNSSCTSEEPKLKRKKTSKQLE
jgi:nucleoside-triphosphatase